MIDTKQENDLEGQHIRLSDVTIRAGNQTLIRDQSATFESGQVTLIVGPSGVGKSMLLRAMAAMDIPAGVSFRGEVYIGDSRLRAGRVGVVFQDFALFDEMSPKGNIQFAQNHAVAKGASREAVRLMEELQIPTGVKTRQLSGGQRQRLAIARALAARPQALLYDEPTSGLDPHTADRVAELIRRTTEDHGQTTIVVTHDYRSLIPIADRVFVLDPRERALIEVDPAEWDSLDERLKTLGSDQSNLLETDAAQQKQGLGKRVFSRGVTLVGNLFAGTSTAAMDLISIPWSMLPKWRSWRWGPYFLAHYLRLVAGPSAWLYLGIAGLIIGFVGTYFTFQFLPYAKYTEPLLVDNLLGAIGYALYRILVPVLATILIAARSGAAVASDIGGKKYGRQFDALQSLRASPRGYLLTGILHSFLIGTPILTGIAYLTASFSSMLVFIWLHPELGGDYWRLHFHRDLMIVDQQWYRGSAWLVGKLLICAVGMGCIAYRQGAAPKNSPGEVSHAVTSTILWATLYVLLVHFAFAFFEFKAMGN